MLGILSQPDVEVRVMRAGLFTLFIVVDEHNGDVVFDLIDPPTFLAREGTLLRFVVEVAFALWTAEDVEEFFA
jgi:hypothetical protein